jgi:hypothetical protein
LLLGTAALLSALGGAAHARAFPKAVIAFAASNLPHFYAGSSKGLWLSDSATLFILAAIFGTVAARPSLASKPLLMLVSLIPAGTAVFIYMFLGNFFAGHLLLLIAALAFFGTLRFPAVAPGRVDAEVRS